VRNRAWAAFALFGVLVACGPIDVPAANIEYRATGPRIVLSHTSPRASFTFSISVNDQARSNGGTPGFLLQSHEVGANRGGQSGRPVKVSIRTEGEPHSRVDLRRGWCRGDPCVGTFSIVFERTADTKRRVSMDWSVAATVNFATSDVPDGATVDVSVT